MDANHREPEVKKLNGNIRPLLFALSDALVMIVYGAVALFGLGCLSAGEAFTVTFYDVRIALLFSTGFMVLSGYVISLVASICIYSHRLPWVRRASLSLGLFFAHMVFFLFLMGEPPFSVFDLISVMFGAATVVLAEATNSLLWGRFASARH